MNVFVIGIEYPGARRSPFIWPFLSTKITRRNSANVSRGTLATNRQPIALCLTLHAGLRQTPVGPASHFHCRWAPFSPSGANNPLTGLGSDWTTPAASKAPLYPMWRPPFPPILITQVRMMRFLPLLPSRRGRGTLVAIPTLLRINLYQMRKGCMCWRFSCLWGDTDNS
ncbi:hypothetical protein LZ32DRAFT_409278 [Colletotrichum eremochloae]|nr:hypothetical protein LZ32DRAFT_409278 [Colletotrichum eremochloae]